ncbi:MAG: hypothetical protein KDA05_12340 [Phycisphaerales bacterium]|nr:hypothetical protein [Phycisphaerales bacterium]
MPEYTITGAKRDTGEAWVRTIECVGEAEARDFAAQHDVLVASVRPVPLDQPIREHPRRLPPSKSAPEFPPSAAPTLFPNYMEIRVRGLFWSILFGVFGGMTLFLTVGWLVALVAWGTLFAGVGAVGAAATRPSAAAPAPVPPVVSIPAVQASAPGQVASAPAKEVPRFRSDAMLIGSGMAIYQGEFEPVLVGGEPHVRWRLTVVSDSDRMLNIGVAAHGTRGREEWRGGYWAFSVPPGEHVLEHTEPLRQGTLGPYSDMRVRFWE